MLAALAHRPRATLVPRPALAPLAASLAAALAAAGCGPGASNVSDSRTPSQIQAAPAPPPAAPIRTCDDSGRPVSTAAFTPFGHLGSVGGIDVFVGFDPADRQTPFLGYLDGDGDFVVASPPFMPDVAAERDGAFLLIDIANGSYKPTRVVTARVRDPDTIELSEPTLLPPLPGAGDASSIIVTEGGVHIQLTTWDPQTHEVTAGFWQLSTGQPIGAPYRFPDVGQFTPSSAWCSDGHCTAIGTHSEDTKPGQRVIALSFADGAPTRIEVLDEEPLSDSAVAVLDDHVLLVLTDYQTKEVTVQPLDHRGVPIGPQTSIGTTDEPPVLTRDVDGAPLVALREDTWRLLRLSADGGGVQEVMPIPEFAGQHLRITRTADGILASAVSHQSHQKGPFRGFTYSARGVFLPDDGGPMSTRELLPDHAPLFDHGGFDVHPIARPGYGAFLVTAYGAVGTGTTVVPLRRPCSP